MARNPQKEQSRVSKRSRGPLGQNEEPSVREYMLEKAADYRGYSTDREHEYERAVKPHVVSPRRSSRGSRSIPKRRRR